MADDDQVNEAKEDINTVGQIFGAGNEPAAPPPPPAAPIAAPTPPPNVTADLDAQIQAAAAKRDAASQAARTYSAQAVNASGPLEAAAFTEKANDSQLESLHYQEQVTSLEKQKAQRQDLAKQGCSPAVIAIAALIGLVAVLAGLGIKSKLDDNGSSKTSAGAAASSCSETGARADHLELIDCANPDAPLDGHWVLVDGLNNPGFDMGVSCSNTCDQGGRQVTVDKADVTMDISGDKITGGTFKTGYSSGDGCTRFDSHVDATVSGGADQVNKYGQLIVDGNQTNITRCDSDLQPVTEKSPFHTSRFYFLSAPDTLTLCYNINATFDACTTAGFSTPPPNGGVAGTFKRG